MGTRWSGRHPARRHGITSPRYRVSGPSGPHSTCIIRISGRDGRTASASRHTSDDAAERCQMKVEGSLFVGCALFFGVVDLVYWYTSKDPTGTTALALSVGLAFLTGFYLLFTGRRLPRRPEDDPRGAIRPGTDGPGFLSLPSWCPLCVCLPAPSAGNAAAVGWSLFLIGLLALLLTTI